MSYPHLEYLRTASEELVRLSQEYSSLLEEIIKIQNDLKTIDDNRRLAKKNNQTEVLDDCKRKLLNYCELNRRAIEIWANRPGSPHLISEEQNYESMRWLHIKLDVIQDDYDSFFDLNQRFEEDWKQVGGSNPGEYKNI